MIVMIPQKKNNNNKKNKTKKTKQKKPTHTVSIKVIRQNKKFHKSTQFANK